MKSFELSHLRVATTADTSAAPAESGGRASEPQALHTTASDDAVQSRSDPLDRQTLTDIIDFVADPIFVKDELLKFVIVNQALCKFIGLGQEQLIGRTVHDILLPKQALALSERDTLLLSSGLPNAHDISEADVVRADGSARSIRITKTLLHTRHGYRMILGTWTDVTDMRYAQTELWQANRQLTLLTHCDALTGLPNRSAFEAFMNRRVAAARGSSASFAVLCMDLNEFKRINDNHGHRCGDDLLKEIGSRLAAGLEPGDYAARLGGDEFVLVTAGSDQADFIRTAERVLKIVEQPVLLEFDEARVTPSIGIARFPQDGDDAGTLIRNADAAMYRAKRTTHRPYECYSPQQSDAQRRRYILETQLRKDLAFSGVGIHLQPICCLSEMRIIGFEALARWEHAKLGAISPEEFIPIAEEIECISKLGEFVLRQACSFIAECGEAKQYIAVNVSNRQLQDPEFLAMVWRILEETGAKPNQLALELTESAICSEEAPGILDELRGQGVEIFIDDFGVGYSNLTRLHQLRFDAIKVDRGFIRDIERGGVSTAMIRTIGMLASEIGVRLIAEGVERVEQAHALKQLGLLYGQGYLYGRPGPPEHWRASRGQVR